MVNCPYAPVDPGRITLTGGILADRTAKNVDNLFMRIDPDGLARVFAETHDSWYAEPEFCGMYLDAAAQLIAAGAGDAVRERADVVARGIVDGQRNDGYLGTYHAGNEFGMTFSVWNQAFVVMGLVSHYEATGDTRCLDAALRCIRYVANGFMHGAHPLLRSINQGIQHACILESAARVYRHTQDSTALSFAEFIVQQTEQTPIALESGPLEYPHVGAFGCLKAIEILVCYRGLLALYAATGRERCLEAAARYRDTIESTQIGITGCGAIGELWTLVGNRPMSLGIDLNPNENCVAVGWMRLCAELHTFLGSGHLYDAVERSLYNHVLGSQAADGSDFSYYQGLTGYKVHQTDPGMYSCCRYRGMNMLARLPGLVMSQHEAGLSLNLYTPCDARVTLGETPVRVAVATDYPREDTVAVTVTPDNDTTFDLWLRIPAWAAGHAVSVNGTPAAAETTDGYVRLKRTWSAEGDTVELQIYMTPRVQRAVVDTRNSAAVFYGPLTLALDSRYGVGVQEAALTLEGETLSLAPVDISHYDPSPIVAFTTPGARNDSPTPLTLVDYASAGSAAPGRDGFVTWIEERKGEREKEPKRQCGGDGGITG